MVIAMGELSACAGSYAIIPRKVADPMGMEGGASQSLQSKCLEESKHSLSPF